MAEKYNASNIALGQILNFIKSGKIAIPEIQRPFVWKPKQSKRLTRFFILIILQGILSFLKVQTSDSRMAHLLKARKL